MNDHRQRPIQLARHRRQIPRQNIGILTHNTKPPEVGKNVLNQIRRLEPCERRLAQFNITLILRLHHLQRLADLIGLQRLQLQQDLTQIPLDPFLRLSKLHRRLMHKRRPLPRLIQIERVHMEQIRTPRHQIHLQRAIAQVLFEAAHTIRPIPDTQMQLVITLLQHHLRARLLFRICG